MKHNSTNILQTKKKIISWSNNNLETLASSLDNKTYYLIKLSINRALILLGSYCIYISN